MGLSCVSSTHHYVLSSKLNQSLLSASHPRYWLSELLLVKNSINNKNKYSDHFKNMLLIV